MPLRRAGRRVLLLVLAGFALLGGGASVLVGTCGPFTDTANDGFCPFVLEIFTLNITTGTTATTYSPGTNVTRLQMAAFLSRTVDRVLQRGGRSASLGRFWTPSVAGSLGLTTVGVGPNFCRSDGADVWVSNNDDRVSRVRASDGKLLETWTGAVGTIGVLVALGRVFLPAHEAPGRLYRIDPRQPPGAVETVASNLGSLPDQIAFDGDRIWSANSGGSVSIVTPGVTIPWTVTTVTTGFDAPTGALYDGSNIWITDRSAGTLLKLNNSAAILQTVTVGVSPKLPLFDGTNIWVSNENSNSISVVRASTGAVLATLTGNGLDFPAASAFDGQRVLVANNGDSNVVSLWKAADLTPIGSFATGENTHPFGACSDGASFWITFATAEHIARF